MKVFSDLSDEEIQSVIEYFKNNKMWGSNPFIAQKNLYGMPNYPYAVCMTYAFNEKGEVYDMEAKDRPTYMTMNSPPIIGRELNVDLDLKRLERFEKENGKIEFNVFE